MTDDQTARLAAFGSVETVLDAHPEPLGSIPAAGRTVADFRERLAALRTAIRGQADYAPQGTAKDEALGRLTAAAVPLSQTVAAWAEDAGDTALADQIAFTKTDFSHGRQQDALDRAALVHVTAQEHAADLAGYGVTGKEIEALDALVGEFADALGLPRHAIVERRAQTEIVERLFPETERLLERRLDRFVARFDGSVFHAEYHAARRIVDR